MRLWHTIDSLESFCDDLHVFDLNLSPNPAGCSNTSAAKVQYSLTTSEKERLRLVITPAFFAGRGVKVKLHSTACQDNLAAISTKTGAWRRPELLKIVICSCQRLAE